jgi:hypothetical protein
MRATATVERRPSAIELAVLVAALLVKRRQQHDEARRPVRIPERDTPGDILAAKPEFE